MIIGDGDVAKALSELIVDKDFLFFASGVSNSKELRESEYQREKDLLLSQDENKHIVYFSSLSIFYATERYQQHKIEMERIIKNTFYRYTIIRIGNISWGSNPNTIINFFKNKIKNNEPFEIQDTFRHIIDKKEFLYWISMIPSWSCEMNCPGRMLTVKQIVKNIRTGLF